MVYHVTIIHSLKIGDWRLLLKCIQSKKSYISSYQYNWLYHCESGIFGSWVDSVGMELKACSFSVERFYFHVTPIKDTLMTAFTEDTRRERERREKKMKDGKGGVGKGSEGRTWKKGVPKASLSHFIIKYYITTSIRASFIFSTPHNKNSCVSMLTIQFKPLSHLHILQTVGTTNSDRKRNKISLEKPDTPEDLLRRQSLYWVLKHFLECIAFETLD